MAESYKNWSWMDLVLLVLLSLVIVSSQDESCQLDNIPIQSGFDPQRYAGKWYEMQWLPPYFETTDTILGDYTETYTPSQSGDVIAVEGRGRNGNSFITFTKEYLKSEDSKYYSKVSFNNETIQVDYWIVSTDYTHYSLCYGCTAVSEEGTCDRAHAWVFSRTPVLDDQYYNIIDTYLSRLCLNRSDFLTLSQGYESGPVPSQGRVPVSIGVLTEILIGVLLFYGNCE